MVPAWQRSKQPLHGNSPEADTGHRGMRHRGMPSSAQVPGQFICSQGRDLLQCQNAVTPRFPQSGHDVYFRSANAGRGNSGCRDKCGDHLASLADADGFTFMDPRFDPGEFIPEFSDGRRLHVNHNMSHTSLVNALYFGQVVSVARLYSKNLKRNNKSHGCHE
jgi:hypothetical protein